MFISLKLIFVFLLGYAITSTYALPVETNFNTHQLHGAAVDTKELQRRTRQFDLTVSADHDDKDEATDLALEAIANLWRSDDGKTEIEGSAKVLHHSNSLQSGNTRYSASLHLHHDYRRNSHA